MELLKNKFRHIRRTALMAFMLTSVTGLMAQDGGQASFWTEETILYTVLGLVFVTALLVLVVAVYVLQLLKTFLLKDMSEEQRERFQSEPSFWQNLWTKWNDFRPMEQEEEIMLDHDYDGIKELDNHLPPWWKGLFYLTILYGVVYLLIFHVFKTSPLQAEQYDREIAAAEERLKSQPQPEVDFDETTVTFTDAAADLIAGKETFERFCATCHKADGGGLAGPNLTDQYWKNGGGIKNIFATIKNGVPTTAMIAWEQSLNPIKIQQVASYVITLEGTNPPGAKAAEGDLWVEPAAADTTTVTND